MKVAAYQAPLLPIGAMGVIELIKHRVKECEAKGVSILCCPETILGGFADDAPRPSDLALNVASGQLQALLAPIASATVMTIVGFTEAVGDGLFNSAAILFEGRVSAVYRKRHPAIRSSVYRPGYESPVYTHGALRFGIMICNDTNFPNLAADMATRGARVLFVPSNNALRRERADVVALTRETDVLNAVRNRMAVVRADVAGEVGGKIAYGTSAIVDPEGLVLQSGRRLREDLLVDNVATDGDEGA